jgi:hypothetical protein
MEQIAMNLTKKQQQQRADGYTLWPVPSSEPHWLVYYFQVLLLLSYIPNLHGYTSFSSWFW